MLRFAAAVVITAVGGIIGFGLADRLDEGARVCGRIGQLIDRLGYMIGSRSDDVYAICRQLKGDPELKKLGFLSDLPDHYKPGSDFRESWTSAVNSHPEMGEEESGLLTEIGCILGKTDAQSQVCALNELRKELDRLTAQRAELRLKKGRLYRSTGLLMGAMAGILVL